MMKKTNSWPAGDYVSPGLEKIQLDDCFPNMKLGDRYASFWFYLRRNIPHHWYVDQRQSGVGFVSRDEAHILYNTALKFQGQNALEIGCWMGWSAAHLAAAGVRLDVIDPRLGEPLFYDSVINSLQQAGVYESVNLVPGYSPQAVIDLASQSQRQWSLIFIDGHHEAPAPLQDAIACEQFAAADALILFHDLASPDVGQGLDYLHSQGWNVVVYQTMQIMAAAWRGNVEPVIHQPDPTITWHLPPHLQKYAVSGLPKVSDRFSDVLQAIQPFTFLSEAQLFSLYSQARHGIDYLSWIPQFLPHIIKGMKQKNLAVLGKQPAQ